MACLGRYHGRRAVFSMQVHQYLPVSPLCMFKTDSGIGLGLSKTEDENISSSKFARVSLQ